MGDKKRTLVLFPGSWANKTEKHVRWWMRHVISYFTREGWNIVIITYRGEQMKDYTQHALSQLNDVPDGVFAICYSAGAQVARSVARERPQLFVRVGLICGLERLGIRVNVLISALLIAFVPLWRVLKGKDLTLDTSEQIEKIMLGSTTGDNEEFIQRYLRPAMHGEPAAMVRQLALPPFRKHLKPFTCPVMAVIPEGDFFIGNATYKGESTQIVRASGDHSLICGDSYQRLRPYLDRLHAWFRQS